MSRRPRPVGEAIADLRTGLAPMTLLAAVQSAWATAVGEAIARHSQPVSERNGVVTVRCDGSVWAAELAMMSKALLKQLEACSQGGQAVRDLRFVVAP
jgi:predicted nucleic acid-binding Zn ribbon protein